MDESDTTYSIQRWLEVCPQGYLQGTQYGHRSGEDEPAVVLEDEGLRQESILSTVQLLIGERCALAASSGLINSTPDEAAKRFLATQTLDEARHVEIFTQRLYDLGVPPDRLTETIKELGDSSLIKFAEVLLEVVDKRDFIAGVVGQNVVLEGIEYSVFGLLRAMSSRINPKLAHMLSGAMSDERRHVAFGEATLGALIKQHPEKRASISKMAAGMSGYILETFAAAFRHSHLLDELRRGLTAPGMAALRSKWRGVALDRLDSSELESLLSDTVQKEFKTRLERIGIDYEASS